MQTESHYKKHLRPPPAYLEYPSDLLANMKFRRMSLPERGLWQTMRLECWVNKMLPKNPEEIAFVLNLPLQEVQANLTSGVLGFFVENEQGLYCKELEEYRVNQLQRQIALSQGGKKGGEKTQQKNRDMQAISQGKVQGYPEGRLKPLRGDEMNGDEMQGEESSIRDYSTDEDLPIETNDEWISDFENSSTEVENQKGISRFKSTGSNVFQKR